MCALFAPRLLLSLQLLPTRSTQQIRLRSAQAKLGICRDFLTTPTTAAAAPAAKIHNPSPEKPTGDPSKLISKCYIKANKTQSRNAATKMLSRPLTFGNLKINKVVCYAKWQREAKPKRRCSRCCCCCCCCGTCGFLGCFWVCGELWEVRLGSCVPRCNKLQKRKTVANIFEF